MMDKTTSRILIVDDEPNIRLILQRTLNIPEYRVDVAVDGEEALLKLKQNNYDLMLIDLQMRKVDGIQVLREAHQKDTETVVIILTAHGSMESAVEALRLGAFDYLFKPASPSAIRERVKEGLAQRQRSMNRRNLLNQIESLKQVLHTIDTQEDSLTPPNTETRFMRSGALTMDRHHREAAFNGMNLELTTTEFDILLQLVSNSPNPLSAHALVQSALGYEAERSEAKEIIKWHIFQLRRKMEPDPQKPQYIKTVRYKGYLWSGKS